MNEDDYLLKDTSLIVSNFIVVGMSDDSFQNIGLSIYPNQKVKPKHQHFTLMHEHF